MFRSEHSYHRFKVFRCVIDGYIKFYVKVCRVHRVTGLWQPARPSGILALPKPPAHHENCLGIRLV